MPLRDILGHDREINILKRALLNKSIAHSFLFTGPEGIGKKLTAISLAKSLNCSAFDKNSPSLISDIDNKFANDFCGTCQNCRDIDYSSYSDVFMIEPRESGDKNKVGAINHVSGIIGIELIRDAQEKLSYKASGTGKKVCIVDGAEKMNIAAQNAFLKTLEEPPPASVIILVINDSAALLPTIISRCQRITFKPLTKNIVKELIKIRLGTTEEAALLLSCLSGGSIGKALKLNMETILEQREKIAQTVLNLSLDDMECIFKTAEEIAKGDHPVEVLEFLKILYRDITILKEGNEDMVINSDLLHLFKKHIEVRSFSKLISGFKLIHKAQTDILPPRYANKQLTVENLLLELCPT